VSHWFIGEGLMVLEERLKEEARRVWEMECQLYGQGALKDKPQLPEILRWPTS